MASPTTRQPDAQHRTCPNCGKRAAHWVPPMLGGSGFFTCSPDVRVLPDGDGGTVLQASVH